MPWRSLSFTALVVVCNASAQSVPDQWELIKDKAATVHGDGSVDWKVNVDCSYLNLAVERVQHLVHSLPDPFISGVHFHIAQTMSDEVAPRIFGSAGLDGPTGNIFIPRRFIADVNVGRELFVFMLLHEIGHTQGFSPLQGPSAGKVNEHDADQWALDSGLTLYGTGSGVPREHILAVVPQQLEAYFSSQFTSSTIGLAMDLGTAMNSYPELDCRLVHLGGAAMGTVSSIDYKAAYPDSCWDQYSPKVALYFNGTPEKTHCQRMPFPPIRKDCAMSPEVCEIRDMLGAVRITLDDVIDPCRISPEWCEMSPAQRAARLRVNVKGISRSERRIARSVSKLQQRVDQLHRNVEETSIDQGSGKVEPR